MSAQDRIPEGPILSAVVLFVPDIDRSAAFYGGLLGLEQVVREPEAAMLRSPAGSHLYLRELKAAHRGSVNIGIQYCIWALSSPEALAHAESWLREHGAFTWKEDYRGVTAVGGRDPDRLAVVVHYPTLTEDPDDIFKRIYNY